jgi:hypothetical protein
VQVEALGEEVDVTLAEFWDHFQNVSIFVGWRGGRCRALPAKR